MCSLLIVFQFLLTQFANQFLGSNQLLLSGFHVFQGHFALVHFIFSNQCNKWDHLGIGITHLLLHFAGIGEYFSTNTCCPYSGKYIHRKSRLLLTKVDKQKLRTVHSFDPCTACAVHIVEPKTGKKFETVTSPWGVK